MITKLKTVTAKLMCNKLNLPVIILNEEFPGLDNWLSKLNQDCIFFMDEFEKKFRRKDIDNSEAAGRSLLSIMDGVHNNSGHSHIFILTTNDMYIDNNLISRPSRIRYIKNFGSVISKNILIEYVDDNLKYPEHRDSVMDFIDTLDMATIDIVKSVVEEVNIHNCSVDEFKRFFNVREAKYDYNCRFYNLYNYEVEGFDWKNSSIEKDGFAHYGEAYTPKHFIKDCREWDSSRRWNNPRYWSITLPKAITKLAKGDMIDGWVISKPLNADGFMELQRPQHNDIRYVYVENPDSRPSIFRDSRAYAYSSDGDDDYGINPYDDCEKCCEG